MAAPPALLDLPAVAVFCALNETLAFRTFSCDLRLPGRGFGRTRTDPPLWRWPDLAPPPMLPAACQAQSLGRRASRTRCFFGRAVTGGSDRAPANLRDPASPTASGSRFPEDPLQKLRCWRTASSSARRGPLDRRRSRRVPRSIRAADLGSQLKPFLLYPQNLSLNVSLHGESTK